MREAERSSGSSWLRGLSPATLVPALVQELNAPVVGMGLLWTAPDSNDTSNGCTSTVMIHCDARGM